MSDVWDKIAVPCVRVEQDPVAWVSTATCFIAGHAEAVLSVQFSPNGRYMASGSGDTTVRMWDLATGTPLHTLKARRCPCSSVQVRDV